MYFKVTQDSHSIFQNLLVFAFQHYKNHITANLGLNSQVVFAPWTGIAGSYITNLEIFRQSPNPLRPNVRLETIKTFMIRASTRMSGKTLKLNDSSQHTLVQFGITMAPKDSKLLSTDKSRLSLKRH